jgi:hypothetical protein
MTSHTISPELVLVDHALRASLAMSPDVLVVSPVSRPRLPAATPPRVPPRRARPAPSATGEYPGRLVGLRVAAAAAVVVASSALVALQGGRDDLSSSPSRAAAHASPSGLPAHGKASGLELRWRSRPGAPFYNVILWREGERVLDLWPRRTTVTLAGRDLEPGTYRWFVYPALPGTRARFDRLVASGTVSV